MQRSHIVYLLLFFLTVSCGETLSDDSVKTNATFHSDTVTSINPLNNEDLPITGLISKLKTAGLPQKISGDKKLEACPFGEEAILKIFLYFWPDDAVPQSTQFINIQKYSENELYTFIGIEFEINDGGSYHAVNFCTYDNKSGKIISEIEGLIFSEGGTDYTEGSIDIRKTNQNISLEMSNMENDSKDIDKTIYILKPEGIFEQI